MGNTNQAVSNLRTLIKSKDRTYTWLSRQTGIPYKRILAEVKHESRPLSLETAVELVAALEAELPQIIGSNQ